MFVAWAAAIDRYREHVLARAQFSLNAVLPVTRLR